MSNKLKLSYLTLLVVLTGALLLGSAVTATAKTTVTIKSIVAGNASVGATTTYTIEITHSSVATNVKYIEVDFASEFNVSGATLDTAITGHPGSVSVNGQVVTYELDDISDLSKDTTTFVLGNIVNPSTATGYTIGVRTLDLAKNVIDSRATTTVTIQPKPAQFGVTLPNGTPVTAGKPFTVTVEAQDSEGDTLGDYSATRTIEFSSTGTGTIPSFEELDFGSGTATTSANFALTNATEEPTITATDPGLGVSGTSDPIGVNPAELDYFEFSNVPSSVTAGEDFGGSLKVTAYDEYGNVATSYSLNTENWSADPGGNPTFGSASFTDGVATFSSGDFVLETVAEGGQKLTFEDTNVNSTGDTVSVESDAITVNPAAADSISVTLSKDQITADGEDYTTITATVSDEYSNTATGYTDAVTFEASLGTLSEVDSNFSDGTATAKLSSTELGTANVVVTSGSFEETTAVTLGNTVYVDGDVGDDSNPGTEERPFASVEHAVTNASAGQTIIVGDGATYAPSTVMTVDKANVTIKAATEATPVITPAGANVFEVTAAGVTIDGLTIQNTEPGYTSIEVDAADATITNNTLTAESGWPAGILLTSNATGATVSGNSLNSHNTMMVIGASTGITLSNNTFKAGINLQADGSALSGIDILDNDLTSEANNVGIRITSMPGGTYSVSDILIQGNTITVDWDGSGQDAGIAFRTDSNVENVDGVVIQQNDIVNNAVPGIFIGAIAGTWGGTSANVIKNNNIYGNATNNTLKTGLHNASGQTITADDNYWGDPAGPSTDQVSSNVVYTPWLDAAYPDGDPVSVGPGDFTRGIVEGWQMVSPHFRPAVEKASSVFGAGSRYNSVFYWDTQAGEYVVGDEANPIDSMKGLWLYSSNVVLPESDPAGSGYNMGDGYNVEADSTLTFVEGDGNESWNMIGVPFDVNWGQVTFDYGTDTGNTPSEAESNGWILNQVMAYNKSNNDYDVVGYNDAGSDVGLLEADTGYWLKVDADLTASPTELVMNIPFNPGAAPSSAVVASILENAPVSTATPPAPPAAPQAVAGLKATAAMSNGSVTFQVAGADVQSINVQVFDLNGEEIFSNSESGNSLSWNANVANGIYLYGVSAKVNGQIKPLGIQKLLVLQ